MPWALQSHAKHPSLVPGLPSPQIAPFPQQAPSPLVSQSHPLPEAGHCRPRGPPAGTRPIGCFCSTGKALWSWTSPGSSEERRVGRTFSLKPPSAAANRSRPGCTKALTQHKCHLFIRAAGGRAERRHGNRRKAAAQKDAAIDLLPADVCSVGSC